MRKSFARITALAAVLLFALAGLGATVPFSTVVANGDLSGFYPGPTVAKVNATTVTTAGGALTTGKVLRVTGASSSDWGALDLANSSAVTGTLPVARVPLGTSSSTLCVGNDSRLSDSRAPTGSASGDLSGTYPGPTVASVNGTTYPAGGALTTGTIPRVTGAASVAYGALDLANASAVTGLLPLASVASGFLKADGTIALSGALNLNSHLIDNVTDPSGAQDAATKNYVDTRPKQVWSWGAGAGAGSTATRWLQAGAYGTAVTATQAASNVLVGVPRTLSEIWCKHDAALVDTVAYTLQDGGSDTALTVTVTTNSTAVISLTGQSVAVAAGDVLTLKSVQSSTTAAASLNPRCTVVGK